MEELTEQQLRDQLETNLFGPLRVVRAALPHLRGQGAGRIIQISSIIGVAAYPSRAGTKTSKWALESLSESLAQEVADFGIKVTLVEPESHATGSTGGVYAEANPLYDGVRQSLAAFIKEMDVGDPAAAGQALLKIVDSDNPPPAGDRRSPRPPDNPADLRRPAQRPGLTGRTFRWRLTASSSQEIMDRRCEEQAIGWLPEEQEVSRYRTHAARRSGRPALAGRRSR